MTKYLTQNMKTHGAKQFLESFSEAANTLYYTFTAKSTAFTDDDNPPDPGKSLKDTYFDIYDDILFGKKINTADVRHMIRNVEWQSGTVYEVYDDQNTNLWNENFFVVADEGTNHYVFKCLNNNGGAASTYKPLRSETDPEDEIYLTNDGYHWKYMYTISQNEYEKFATDNYVPLIIDTQVTLNASNGAIDEVVLTNPGIGYNAYANGTIEESAVGGNTLIYALESITSTLSANSEFYQGSTLYIREGTGEGQSSRIARYLVSESQRSVILDTPFNPLPDTNSIFEISPRVALEGDGTGFRAITTVDPAANSIAAIEILDPGINYTYGTVTISGNTGFLDEEDNPIGNSTATARPIISPPGGHGSDVINELYASRIGISTTFSNNENGTIPTANDYRKVGIIKNPLFANTEITLDSLSTNFTDGETIIHFTPEQSNLVLQRSTFTVANYKTLTVAAWSGFISGENLVSPAADAEDFKTAYVREQDGNDLLVETTSTWSGTETIFNSAYARVVSSVTKGLPAVVTTATAHNLSNADSIRFYNLDGTSTIDDTMGTLYFIRRLDEVSFELYTNISLTTKVDTSGDASASTTGFITTGTNSTTVSAVAATFSGTATFSGQDDSHVTMSHGGDTANWMTLKVKYNGVDISEDDYTHTETTLVLDNETIVDSDVITVEMLSSQVAPTDVSYTTATSAEVSNRSGKVLRVRNIRGSFTTGSTIKGLTSGATATIMALDRSYETFSQLTKLSVFIADSGIQSGNQGGLANTGFSYDQEVYQIVLDPIRNAEGFVHSLENSITRKITNIATSSPARVTTSENHGFTDADKITFDKLNGSLLEDGDITTTYFAKYISDTTFDVYTNESLTSSFEFDNSGAENEASSGFVTAVKAFEDENKTLYLSGVRGHIQDSDDATNTINTIRTEQGAVAEVNGIIEPDLVDGSGEILYIENMSPITRATDQSEKIKLVFEF